MYRFNVVNVSVFFYFFAVIDKQASSIFLQLTSLSSLSSEKDIIVYFEAQGDNINVPSVKLFEKGRAIVHLDEVTQEGLPI